MNNKLKKNESYKKKYMRQHRMICVCLDRKKDKDIVDWIEKQEVISVSIKEALRAWIKA